MVSFSNSTHAIFTYCKKRTENVFFVWKRKKVCDKKKKLAKFCIILWPTKQESHIPESKRTRNGEMSIIFVNIKT